MAAIELKRKFVFDDKDLPDPGEILSVDEVRKYYATKHPELTNATYEQKIDAKENTLVITFSKSYGTKG